jgi:hypothetical protein
MSKRTEVIKRKLTLDDSPCRLCTDAHPEETLHSCKEHMHYHARALKDDAAIAYKTSLSLIFAHVADIHMVMLNALSKRYGHDVSDMLNTVMEDPDWKNIYLHPVLKRMVYFEPQEEKESEAESQPTVVKRSRGRPRKSPPQSPPQSETESQPVIVKRTRTKKVVEEQLETPVIVKRPRGRPKKQVAE